jgi:hypothetical protein
MIFEEETSLNYPFNKKWDELTITEKDAICNAYPSNDSDLDTENIYNTILSIIG